MQAVIKDAEAKANIAANVSRLIELRGISQKELAARTGETEMSISRVARGLHVPGSTMLARIAEALGTSVDSLIYGNGKKSRQSA